MDDMADSQREGAWMGQAYQVVGALDRLEKTVVPIETLYDWCCKRRPSRTEFLGTFSKQDVRYSSVEVSNGYFGGLCVYFDACRRLCQKEFDMPLAPLYHFLFAPLPFLPRHELFDDYLYHCVRQYTRHGHCERTAQLCTKNNWDFYRSARAGEARALI